MWVGQFITLIGGLMPRAFITRGKYQAFALQFAKDDVKGRRNVQQGSKTMLFGTQTEIVV